MWGDDVTDAELLAATDDVLDDATLGNCAEQLNSFQKHLENRRGQVALVLRHDSTYVA